MIGSPIAEVLPLNALSRCPAIVRGSIYVTPDAAEPLSVHCPIYPVDDGTLACIPLAHGETVGSIHLFWERPNAFRLDQRSIVTRIAEHAALAISNRRLMAALQGMASTDPRTGLSNTRAFDQMLEEQDVDIMAWAIGTAAPPARFEGPLMEALKRLHYIRVPP